jgi:hypothetical protein
MKKDRRSFSISMSLELYKILVSLAVANKRSKVGQINYMLEKALIADGYMAQAPAEPDVVDEE